LVTRLLVVSFDSLYTENNIGNGGAIQLSEALKANTALTALDLFSKRHVTSFHSLSTDNKIGSEGAIKMAEALISNPSLTTLNLGSNRLIA
jgi:hypothetical protein